jgi:chromosome segregation ATPase
LLLYHTHFSLFFTIDALATANARISSLEAKLEASRRAFDAATAAKTNAEKSSKSALDKAKKMEKSLADLKKERTQRHQAVALRLNKMSALAGGKYHAFSFPLFELLILILH